MLGQNVMLDIFFKVLLYIVSVVFTLAHISTLDMLLDKTGKSMRSFFSIINIYLATSKILGSKHITRKFRKLKNHTFKIKEYLYKLNYCFSHDSTFLDHFLMLAETC